MLAIEIKFFLFLRRLASENLEFVRFAAKIASFASCDLAAGCNLAVLASRGIFPPLAACRLHRTQSGSCVDTL
jgi:hypothetical protein